MKVSVQGFYKGRVNGDKGAKLFSLSGVSNTEYKELIFIEIDDEDYEMLKDIFETKRIIKTQKLCK